VEYSGNALCSLAPDGPEAPRELMSFGPIRSFRAAGDISHGCVERGVGKAVEHRSLFTMQTFCLWPPEWLLSFCSPVTLKLPPEGGHQGGGSSTLIEPARCPGEPDWSISGPRMWRQTEMPRAFEARDARCCLSPAPRLCRALACLWPPAGVGT
jgi:hypothetical protein